jgi:dihydrofolate synthase/folylpolyglutamate synthase
VADPYGQTLTYLWTLRRLGSRPGLDIIGALLKELGSPERSFRAIHITGSKGKGSTAMFCASVLKAAGLKTGLYTSPHLLSYRERILVDGQQISKKDVTEGVREVRRIAEKLEKQGKIDREPTFFEVTTAMAFRHFQKQKVDAAVIEVGLGGRLDATNTINAPVCVITTLELEHAEIIGPDLEDIAREKAGILNKGAWAVTGIETGRGLDILRSEAFKVGVPLWQINRDFSMTSRVFDRDSQEIEVQTPIRKHSGLVIPMLGAFQARNATVAVAAIDLYARATGTEISDRAFTSGLASANWHGRLERLGEDPLFYVDAAHTPESSREIALALKELEPGIDPKESVILFSSLGDKHISPMMDSLSVLASTIVLVPLRNDRAMSIKEMEHSARGHFQKIVIAQRVKEAISLARAATGPEGLLLATGSTYLVGEVISQVKQTPMEIPSLTDPIPAKGESGHTSDEQRGKRARQR